MRTSKVAQETTKIFSARSPDRVRRSSRQAAKIISAFALGHHGGSSRSSSSSSTVDGDDGEESSSTESALPTNFSADIEDSLTGWRTAAGKGKRKRGGGESPATTADHSNKTTPKTWTSPRKRSKPDRSSSNDAANNDVVPSAGPRTPRAKAVVPRRKPARKTTVADGTVGIDPPSDWEAVYNIVKAMREANPTAPVDTMGCEDLYWRSSSRKEQRYHILTALMLSSQTKDTVTAAAMQRLHTELGPEEPSVATATAAEEEEKACSPGNSSSRLTISNMLATPAARLNELISKVGFHNTKTRHLQQTAVELSTRHGSDVPRTVAELLALPGVGPKMAYLCLGAAWGVTDAGIGVDVHVHRITNLWGWHATATPDQSRRCLQAWLPTDRWHEINRLLVGLGQTVCLPVGRRCGDCRLAGTGLCKGEVKGWEVKAKKKEKATAVVTTTREEG